MKKITSPQPLAALILAMICALAGGMMPTAQALQPQLPGKLSDEQLLGYIGKEPLPPGTIPWQLLRQVKLVENKSKDVKTGKLPTSSTSAMTPEFGPQIRELDKQEVKLYGFVLPLSTGTKQKHFLLSPLPSHCPFCVNQGPDSMVEVVAKSAIEYNQWEPIVMTGKLELVNDPYLFYRLTNAEPIKF